MITKFSQLVGNASNISLLKKGLLHDTLPQFILLSGVHGTGKSTVAELIGMTLSCDSQSDDGPCGTCTACKANIKALERGGGGISSFIEKVNMAKVAKEGSMTEQMKSTFQILHSNTVHVKVFEEFHILSENDQALLLEETTRIPQNTYVILTTTKESLILKELVSRCLVFSFNRLTLGETNLLVDLLHPENKFKKDIIKLIHKKCDGIPRNINILTNFLLNSEADDSEIAHLLGIVDKTVFISLLTETRDFQLYLELVEDLQASVAPDTLLTQLKQFLTNLLFAIEGDIKDYFSSNDIKKLCLTSEQVYRILQLIESCPTDLSSINLLFFKIRRLITPTSDVVAQKVIAANARSLVQTAGQSKDSFKTPEKFKGGGRN